MLFHRIKIIVGVVVLFSTLFSQVIISEVMYDLDGSDSPNEFVELYNTSDFITYDLSNWTISDSYSTDDITDAGFGLSLPPESYAVIFEGDYDIATGIYNGIVPVTALIVKVDDSSIGNSLSNSDSLYLKDNSNSTLDSFKWTDTAPDGFSLEKIRLENANTSDNWSASKDSLGTPGGKNSVAPLSIDGAIYDNVIFTPAYPDKNDNVEAMVPIKNIGLNDFTGTLTAIVNGAVVGVKNIATMVPEEMKNHYLSISSLPSGRHKVTFELSILGDSDLSNNTVIKKLGISFEPGVIQINEFHAEPGDDQSEFVELVVSRSIVIDGWHIQDKTSSRLLPITYLEKNDYVVLANDSSLKSISNPDAKYLIPYDGLPTLNNSGDNLYLVDMNHTIIDSLIYGSGWPVVADSSTEKLNPFIASNDPINWKTSAAQNRMTPGYVNSNYLSEFDGEIITNSIVIEPHYPKAGEAILMTIPITNHGSEAMSGLLNIEDINNTVIGSSVVTGIARRDTAKFTFNLSSRPSGIHPIQIYLDVTNDSNMSNNTVADSILISYNFGDILINEFLAAPSSTQAEFVELFSCSDIDLFNWSIEDATHNRKYFMGESMQSGAFVVLSEDPAFRTIMPDDAVYIEVQDFPSLNNYGDAIYLRDFTGTIIDSLIYTTWWELESGKSTEKIHPSLISTDSTIWKLSTDPDGMTPGRTNSVAAMDVDGVIITDQLVSIPQYPSNDQNFQLTIPITNIGLQTISGELNVMHNSSVLANYQATNIVSGDTIYYNIDVAALPSGIHTINIQLDIDNDENTDNNLAEYSVKVSYDFGDVTINEFCADPDSPLFEFVELYTLNNIDLFDWELSDNRKNPISFGEHKIGENVYIVLSENADYDLLNTNVVYYPNDNFPSLNNSGDGIYLYDFTGKIIDSLIYDNSSWSIESGPSTEKIFPTYNSNDPNNWQVCTNPMGATFGFSNSVLLKSIDGTILSELTSHYPSYPHSNESIAFSIAIKNTGIDTIEGRVSILNENDLLGSTNFSGLASNDTIIVSFNIDPLLSGNNSLQIQLDVPNDADITNNLLDCNIYVSHAFGTVVLNEFLANPDSSQAEFVEIISFNDIDLSNWSISDNTLKPFFFGDLFASANQPIVITGDSAFAEVLPNGTPSIVPINGCPTLNNESDGIYLFDASGTVIDSLLYDASWPLVDGRSAEKYRPDFESNDVKHWGSAVNSAAMTPGKENSLYFEELSINGSIVFEQNPFSPDGDGIADELLIQYKLPFEQGIVKLQIFDMTGRMIATPYWNVHFPQEGILRWDGNRDNGDAARIGIYIIKLSAKDASSNKTWEKVKTVVLAKQL